MTKYQKYILLSLFWLAFGLAPVVLSSQSTKLCVDSDKYWGAQKCDKFLFREPSRRKQHYVRLLSFTQKSSGGNIGAVLDFAANVPEEERTFKINFGCLDYFVVTSGKNESIKRRKYDLKIAVETANIKIPNNQLEIINTQHQLYISSGSYPTTDNLKAYTEVDDFSNAFISFKVKPGVTRYNETISIPFSITQGNYVKEFELYVTVDIKVELPPPPPPLCEQWLGSGKALRDWCACLGSKDCPVDCQESARENIKQYEAALWKETLVNTKGFGKNYEREKNALVASIAAAKAYQEAVSTCELKNWPNSKHLAEIVGGNGQGGSISKLKIRLAEVEKILEEIAQERRAWNLMLQKINTIKEGEYSLAQIEYEYESFLNGDFVRQDSDYRAEAERIISEGQYKAINRVTTDSLGTDWVIYTFENVKRLIISRDPLNDNNWEVDYSRIGSVPPQLIVRQLRASESYRLFIYDEEWEKVDTLNLSKSFDPKMESLAEAYYFSFVGGVGPYELSLWTQSDPKQSIWQGKGITEADFSLTKDSLQQVLASFDGEKLKGDSIHLTFLVSEGKGKKTYSVNNGTLLVANPQYSGSMGLIIALSLLALLVLGVLIFVLMRRRHRKRQPTHPQQHQYN